MPYVLSVAKVIVNNFSESTSAMDCDFNGSLQLIELRFRLVKFFMNNTVIVFELTVPREGLKLGIRL